MGTPNGGAPIECAALTKRYGDGRAALCELTLEVPAGACFGLLGANGAGKSTLVRLILGFLLPSSGTLRVLGEEEVTLAHPRLGYVPELTRLEGAFTGRELLRHYAALAGLPAELCRQRTDALLERVDLARVAGRRVGSYSKGMAQRLAIAQALIADPELLILDEPTSGLDPAGQYEVRQLIRELHGEGRTVLLCSHYLAEVAELCDRVAILEHGQLVAVGTVAELLSGGDVVEIVLAGNTLARIIAGRLGLDALIRDADGQTLRISAMDQPGVLRALVGADVPILSLRPVTRSLEDAFVELTRHRPVARSGQ